MGPGRHILHGVHISATWQIGWITFCGRDSVGCCNHYCSKLFINHLVLNLQLQIKVNVLFGIYEVVVYDSLQLFEHMCMMLGGRVAESIIFNSVTSGMLLLCMFTQPCGYCFVSVYLGNVTGKNAFNASKQIGMYTVSKNKDT